MTYLFNDTELAAHRLQVLADVFASSSRTFFLETLSDEPSFVLDLGCGPGYTTRLLAETTRAKRTTGLDSSEHFIAQAHKHNASAQIGFLRHDITQVPFPVEPANLIFCRMLLTHLRDPQAIIERWATQLRPMGLLLLEEVEFIQIQHPVLRAYLGMVEAMLAQQANQLYVGSLLDKQQVGGGLKRLVSRIYHLPVATKQAARMFSMNIPAWKHTPFIQERYGDSIEDLERTLQEMAQNSTASGEISWEMRQIVYQRV